MAVSEPDNELWEAVKAIDGTIWPPDDEDDVLSLAEDWREAGELADVAGTELANARAESEQAWRDRGGEAMGQQLGNGVVTLESQRRDCEQQAQVAERYAAALADVKNAIVRNVDVNLPAYLQLGNPVYGAAGAAKQQEFARKVAADLKALVEGQARGMQAPREAPDTGTTVGLIGDIAGGASAVLGGLSLVPVLAPFTAPAAAVAGTVALGTHLWDLFATGSYDDPNAWAGVAGDAVGVVPGVKAAREAIEHAGDVARLTPAALDVVGSVFDLAMQVPTAVELVGPDRDLEKDVAGWGSFVKNSGQAAYDINEFLRAARGGA